LFNIARGKTEVWDGVSPVPAFEELATGEFSKEGGNHGGIGKGVMGAQVGVCFAGWCKQLYKCG
jgi:hypothetical protein